MDAVAEALAPFPPPDLAETEARAGVCLLACNAQADVFVLTEGNRLRYSNARHEGGATDHEVRFADGAEIPPDAAIHRMSFNGAGTMLLLYGPEEAYIASLPLRGRAQGGAGAGAWLEDFRLEPVADAWLGAGRRSILDAQWHPGSDEHVGVLAGVEGGECRFGLCSGAFAEPEQVFPLPDGMVAFAFAAPASWYRFAVWFRGFDGAHYALCPVVPLGIRAPKAALAALRSAAQRKLRAAERSLAAAESGPGVHAVLAAGGGAGYAEVRRLRDQLDWLAAAFGDLLDLPADNGAADVAEYLGGGDGAEAVVEALADVLHKPKPRLQGPLKVPNQAHMGDTEGNAALLDLTAAPANAFGLVAGAIPVLASVCGVKGSLELYLAADDIEPSFLDDGDEGGDNGEGYLFAAGPELAAIDTLFLPAGVAPHGSAAARKPVVMADPLDGDAFLVAAGGSVVRCELPWKRVLGVYIAEGDAAAPQGALVPSLTAEAVRSRVSYVASLSGGGGDDILGVCMTASSLFGHVVLVRTGAGVRVINLTRERYLSRMASGAVANLGLNARLDGPSADGAALLEYVAQVSDQVWAALSASPTLLASGGNGARDVGEALDHEDLVRLMEVKQRLQDDVVTPLRALEGRVRVTARELETLKDLQEKQLKVIHRKLVVLSEASDSLRARVASLRDENEALADRAAGVLGAGQTLQPQVSDAERRWKAELTEAQAQLIQDDRQLEDLGDEVDELVRRRAAAAAGRGGVGRGGRDVLNGTQRQTAELLLKTQHAMITAAARSLKAAKGAGAAEAVAAPEASA